jgi:putative transposase
VARGPKPPVVVLSTAEREGLERLARAHGTAQQVAVRARLVLAAAAGQSNGAMARQEGVSVDTARLWRGRWLAVQATALADRSVEARLADAPRPGAPARITPEQVCRMVAVACAAPAESGRPIGQWTGREIAEELIKRGIVDRLSPRHAARLLKGGRHPTASGALLADAVR